MTDLNEALRLADRISPETDWYEFDQVTWCNEAATLLRQQAERIAELEGERDKWKNAEHALSGSYVRVREAIGAMRPPSLETEELWGYVEQTARSLTAERDQLRAEVERLRAAMTVPTIEPNSQNWAGMDGAIAFHLIERHADSWADAGRMMREWLEANAPAIDHARTTHKD